MAAKPKWWPLCMKVKDHLGLMNFWGYAVGMPIPASRSQHSMRLGNRSDFWGKWPLRLLRGGRTSTRSCGQGPSNFLFCTSMVPVLLRIVQGNLTLDRMFWNIFYISWPVVLSVNKALSTGTKRQLLTAIFISRFWAKKSSLFLRVYWPINMTKPC